MAALDAFAADPLAAVWRKELARGIGRTITADATDAELQRTGYAGFWRRSAAWAIDAMLCGAILPSIPGLHVDTSTVPEAISQIPAEERAKIPASALKAMEHADKVHVSYDPTGILIAGLIAIYVVVLVSLLGQTFGMLVMDLRVVDVRLQRVGPVRVIGRYLCLIGSICLVYPLFRIFGRVQPFEKWSGTRLVQARALEERRAAAAAGM
jgi:uncharacterized RDD family membrane protein YckC